MEKPRGNLIHELTIQANNYFMDNVKANTPTFVFYKWVLGEASLTQEAAIAGSKELEKILGKAKGWKLENPKDTYAKSVIEGCKRWMPKLTSFKK